METQINPVQAATPGASTPEREVVSEGKQVKKGLLFGLVSGFAAITCCVSPVVLALLGVATAAEAVTLGDTLYYEYGWYFRAAGIAIAGVAVYLYLRRRGGLRRQRRRKLLAHAGDPRRSRCRHLRRPLLVHQVPGHLVRLVRGRAGPR